MARYAADHSTSPDRTNTKLVLMLSTPLGVDAMSFEGEMQ
jgi:hypothetical protein